MPKSVVLVLCLYPAAGVATARASASTGPTLAAAGTRAPAPAAAGSRAPAPAAAGTAAPAPTAAGSRAPATAATATKSTAVVQRPPPYADVAYGNHERQVLDFWKAESPTPTPVVFHIHGGGWVNGDKRPAPSLDQFLAAGISVASINYRFVTQAIIAGVKPPVRWPLADAARALQFVRSRAVEWNIDPRRIGATGGSSGACSSLWLALHDDMAEPNSPDPVARQSTRLACAAVLGAQTSLDPAQLKEWTPNSRYGGHAFGFMPDPNNRATRDTQFAEFLAARASILPWIKEYSPIEHVSADDPPIYLQYSAPPALGQPQKDPTHTANYGLKLQERLAAVGVPCELAYGGAVNVRHANCAAFLIAELTTKPKAQSAWPAGKTDTWHGHVRRHFEVEGCKAWVVEPRRAAPGRPWTWCMEFPDAFTERTGVPQLLAGGFHHVHIVVGNTFGCPEAVRRFDAFFGLLQRAGLAKRGALIAISRGGLYAYNFAAAWPERVACIYGDAPVCDFRSWPMDKSPRDWAALLKHYGFKDEAEARAYKKCPVDRLAPLAAAGVALLHVVGDADEVVPVAENTARIEDRYRALGGRISVIHKPGVGHHPHGLDDPRPVVDFVVKETGRANAGGR